MTSIDYKKQFKDARQSYGQLADDMGGLIRAFRDLAHKNVYFTAKMGSVKDEYSGLLKYSPSMPGKMLTNALPFFFDEVLVLRINQNEHGDSWRYLQTTLDMQFIAKDRSGKLDPMEKPDLTNLFNKIVVTPQAAETTKQSKEVENTKEKEKEVQAEPADSPVPEKQVPTTAINLNLN